MINFSMTACNAINLQLQGIRGLAVAAVILFHAWPNYFPNGYVGVDMFFVLSGYLMTLILSKDPLSLIGIQQFYSRRIKRIVPLYYLIVIVVIIMAYFRLFYTDLKDFRVDAFWALGFCTNMQTVFHQEDYFENLSSYKFLLHAWSLGAEMQFYLIAPFLISFIFRFTNFSTKIAIVAIIQIASELLYLFSDDSTSFNLMFCRIWQFMVGTLAHLITSYSEEPSEYQFLELDDKEDDDDDQESQKINPQEKELSQILNWCCSNGLAVLLGGLSLFPISIPATVIRFVATFLTGIIILFGNSILPSILLNNRVIVYFGDISYILYLVHWPTLLFNRYMEIANESGGVLISVLLAVVVHHFVEKPIIASKWSVKTLIRNIIKLILIAGFLLELAKWKIEVKEIQQTSSSQHPQYFRIFPSNWSYTSINKTQIKGLNKYQFMTYDQMINTAGYYPLDPKDKLKKGIYNFPHFKTTKPEFYGQYQADGNLEILVIGNSKAPRLFPGLVLALKSKYKIIRQYSYIWCPPFKKLKERKDKCSSYTNAVEKAIKSLKPDIVIVDFWYSPELYGPVKSEIFPDSGYIAMQDFIDSVSPFTCQIVMTLPHLTFKDNIGREFPKRLSQGLPLDKLNMEKSVWEEKRKDGMKRIDALNCTKCTFINMADAFCDSKMCYAYDKKNNIPYFEDWHHTTMAGLFVTMEHFKSIFLSITENVKCANRNETIV